MRARAVHFVVAICGLSAIAPVKGQDSAVINFTADLETLTVTNLSNPLESGPLAFFAAQIPDVLRLDGQIWLQNYTGDGTYTAGFNNVTGNRILIHSPLLERLEAQTWRAEDASDHGVVNIVGDPISQRNKWLLPDDTPNGVFNVAVAGGQITSLNYLFDFFANSGLPFADPNEGAGNPNLALIRLDEIILTGDASHFGAPQIFAAGSSEYLGTPYGLNTQLETTTSVVGSVGAFSPGTAGSTVGDTTIGQLLNEINSNTDEMGGSTGNISNTGRLNGKAFPLITNPEQGDGYLADIFAATTGNLYVFNGASDLGVSITVTEVPEPGTLALAGLVGLLGLDIRRRR